MAFRFPAKGTPLIIAGPCSAESREQLLTTARALAQTGRIALLRAGLWKPRTNPDSFAGMGAEALPWLMEAREATGIGVATEVASAHHVEQALQAGVDLLWVGARTTVNPFLIEEIAEAVAPSEVPLLIKNPLNPDIELWAGAVARFERAGIARERIGLVHRGFSRGGVWRYRNDPMWHLALEMQRRYPDLLMLCDPSHIAGCREYVGEVARMAANLNYDGLIVESHYCPDQALSDAHQQLTPEEFVALLDSIAWRKRESDDITFQSELLRHRDEIDALDEALFDLLSRRMEVADSIGRLKRESSVMILQSDRWAAIVERILSRSEALGLSEEFLRTILDAIHMESIRHQNRILNP